MSPGRISLTASGHGGPPVAVWGVCWSGGSLLCVGRFACLSAHLTIMTTSPLPETAPLPARPMRRVGPLDFPVVVWVMATQFARPGRDVPPVWWARLALLPVMALLATTPGTRHWDRRAVLTVRRRFSLAVITWWVVSLVVVLLGAAPIIVTGSWWVLTLLGVVLVAPAAAIWWVRKLGRRLPRRQEPLTGAAANGQEAPKSRWTATMAAATPGTDAIRTVFAPHVIAVLPPGETVRAKAASAYLADRYVEAGFTRVASSTRDVFYTAP